MKIKLDGTRKDNETGEQQPYELYIYTNDIACLYRDKYGVAITTVGGRYYRVNHTVKEIEEICDGYISMFE
jgi:hypothetical protein